MCHFPKRTADELAKRDVAVSGGVKAAVKEWKYHGPKLIV
jgi:hypothetical protein